MSHLVGKFVWFELVTRDLARAKVFYGELFGWKISEMPMGKGSYTLFEKGPGPVGGAIAATEGRSRWASYLSVADVDASAARAVELGGQQVGAAVDVPGVGRMAEVRDPTGAAFHLFHAAEGDQPDAETTPGEFHWNELSTRDPARAVAFYRDLSGYTVESMDMGPIGTYHVLQTGETMRAGIMKAPSAEVPTAWLPYVRVKNVDETLRRATELGAQVMAPAEDAEMVGRFAVLIDPTGAAIAVITPAPGG